ncbi:MAG: DUF433 domain-containing protein [Anaerolineales bacterium]|nr:DUF433 domain-containing protein [Anaerolineales bacterium]MCB0008381.1 DUF433 domain-containing protein [Anaerolineales bacterium]MCB0029320.1 DUF433 domain-containing protein [Anaerolineales bacterium]MCB8959411.1 DUF433 domain-containing protein [Ardenticatenales bacterium]
MARYALNLPNELKQEAAEIAREQGISLNQFILWAVSEKVGLLRNQLADPQFPQIVYRRGGSGIPTPVLAGTGIRVQTVVVSANQWGMSAEEIAYEYDRPVNQIREALSFYQVHKQEIDAHIALEAQQASEQHAGSNQAAS